PYSLIPIHTKLSVTTSLPYSPSGSLALIFSELAQTQPGAVASGRFDVAPERAARLVQARIRLWASTGTVNAPTRRHTGSGTVSCLKDSRSATSSNSCHG